MAELKVRTSAGNETATQTVSRIKKALGTSGGGSSGGGSRTQRNDGLGALGSAERTKNLLAKGQSMLDQTRVEGSTPYAGSIYDRNFRASLKNTSITPSEIKTPAVAPGLPPPAETTQTDVGDVTTPFGEAANMGMEGFNVTFKDGKWVQSDVTGTDAATANYLNRNNSIMDVWANRESAADIWNDVLKQTGRDQYAKEVGQYTGDLNAIIAKRDADVLSLEGQGRGIPEVIIGGQQAQINREAAIKALPIQAMLATAQGNLEMANQQLTQLFQVRMADATATTNFQLGVVNSLFDFADKKEQRQFETIQAEIARKDTYTKMNIQRMDDWAKMAVETEQPSIVGAINKLDPADPEFNSKFAAITGQIVKPKSAGAGTADYSIEGGYILNKRTGQYEKLPESAPAGTEAIQDNLVNSINVMLNSYKVDENGKDELGEYLGLANEVKRRIPGTAENVFMNQHNNVVSQFALGARGQLKGQGAVSDFEGRLLERASTGLSVYQDPEKYRWWLKQGRGAIQTSQGIPAHVKITAPDGTFGYGLMGSEDIQSYIDNNYSVEYQ